MSSLNIPRRQSEGPSDADDPRPADSSPWLYDNNFEPEDDRSQSDSYLHMPITLDASTYQSLPAVDNNCNEFLASQNESVCDSTGPFAMNSTSLSPIFYDHGSTVDYSLSGVDAAEPTFGGSDITLGDWSSIALQNTAAPDLDLSMSAYENRHLESLAIFAFDNNPFPGIETDHESAAAPEAALLANEALHPTTPTTLPRQFQCTRSNTKNQSAGETCRSSFHQQRDYDRHLRTVHAEKDDPKYRCRCTASTARKDNYMRHIQKCAKELREPFYHCKCGDECRDKSAHLRHVKACAKCNGKRGRPSGTRGTA
ncbi:hypothetical protein PFICI_00178 [Pestalotiopsis fici W106-1]|uniref:Uncharacterized protein n=1 Tax=Pestalotiopsis fici (strain W106-1 / CGMCC3.15140) TaxID=1229662 RepID=W3XK24_PESFW|nr:uncharacterized protein PFICI_00178 [Pestalotiopsis fici W106-1]ETS86350.1 hypothetical protein PFICI_00178 [Pestalotiopsis fici W106-1]